MSGSVLDHELFRKKVWLKSELKLFTQKAKEGLTIESIARVLKTKTIPECLDKLRSLWLNHNNVNVAGEIGSLVKSRLTKEELALLQATQHFVSDRDKQPR